MRPAGTGHDGVPDGRVLLMGGPPSPKVQRLLDRYRRNRAARPLDWQARNDQRTAATRQELLDYGVTDLAEAALGWLWATQAFLDQMAHLGVLAPPVLVEALDNMSAAGMAVLDAALDPPEAPEPTTEGQEPS